MATPLNVTSPRPTPAPTAPASRTDTAAAPATRPATPGSSTADTFETAAPRTSGPVLAPTPTATPTPTYLPTTTSTGEGNRSERNGFRWISQLEPEGLRQPANAEVNCGPAVLAMAARKIGFGNELDDAALIEKLAGIGGTKPGTGTSMNGIVAMARAIGLPVDQTEAKFPGFDQKWLDAQLDQGKSVVANGALQTEEGPSGHFILVTGRGENGTYEINDPWNEANTELSAEQLGAFLQRNPVHHGAAVALG